MSLPEAEDGKPNSSLPANYDPEQQQTLLEAKPPSSSRGTNSNTSSNNNNNDNNNNNLQISHQKFQTEESDEDLFRVPDVEAPPPVNSAAISKAQNDAEVQHGKRGGRNPTDKEYRRLKRLLRNRVSAQQARERKKIYVNDLELRAKELDERNSKLEEKISTLTNENTMLRKILMNTRPKADENIEPEQDKLVKS